MSKSAMRSRCARSSCQASSSKLRNPRRVRGGGSAPSRRVLERGRGVRSYPALKPLPAPRRITACTARSSSASHSASFSSVSSSNASALRFSGRFNVIRARPFSTWYSIVLK